MKYYKKGKHTTFGVDAYYNKDTAANILAFHTLAKLKGAHIQYDSRVADCFRLIYKNGNELQFKNCGDGLYTFVNPKENIKFESNNKEQPNEEEKDNITTQKEIVDVQTQYIQTVKENEKLMSKKEIERAQHARNLQEYLGWPSTQEFINIINGNEIRNIDITIDDIKRALVLYGEPTQCIRGKLTRRRPLPHDTMEFLQQPLPIELYDKRIELFLDLFKFAGTWFIIIESSRIKYVDIDVMSGQGLEHIIKQVKQCIHKYNARGLQISGAHVDNQFYKSAFQRAIAPTILIPYATEEHVSKIERRIRTVKERMRAVLSGLPFRKLPKVMIRGLATKVKNMINKFPVRKGGVSPTLSPEEIVEGKRKLDGNRRRINFGQYAEVYDGTTNTVANRSIGGIAMYATNARDGFAFMCIETGRCRHSNNWIEKPITEDVIAKVENLTKEGVEVPTLMSELDMIVPEDIIDSSEYIRMADERIQRHELKSQEDSKINTSSMEHETYNVTDNTVETDGEDSDSNNTDSPEEQNNGQENEIYGINEDNDHDILIDDGSDVMYNEQRKNIENVGDDREIEYEGIMYDDKTSDAINIQDDTDNKTSDVINIQDDTDNNNDDTIPTLHEEEYEPVLDDTDIITHDTDDNLGVNTEIQEDSKIQNKELKQTNEEESDEINISDNNRHDLRAKVREKLNKLTDERRSKKDSALHTKRRIIPERVRYQPRRNVRTREQYRKEQIEGSSSIQQNIGTQCFQRKGRGWSRGFRRLKQKYIGAVNLMTRDKLNKHNNTSEYSACINACFAQQVSANKGFKEYGERAVAAMMKELIQLDKGAVKDKPVIEAIEYNKISEEERRKALDAVNLIELKRDGRLKGRSCANGSKQRSYLTEFDSVASPTVSLEGFFTTLLISAYEGRKNISFDVPGAFLQAEMPDDKLVLLRFKGRLAEMLGEINDEYRKHIRRENGKTVLYVKVIRAIYGCIESALQWYKLFTTTLENMGFKINPYDKCVANKWVNGKQLSIAWHVDDCIASHVDESVLDDFARDMINEFGEMEITKGSCHDFLGMKISFNDDKSVSVDMRNQIAQVIEEFEKFDEVDSATVTPAAHHLFSVNPNAEKLSQELSVAFHSITSKLGYIMKRGRPDIETGISFLMKRVSKSDKDDWGKLRRIVGFLKRTIEDVRIIGATSITEIMTFVDSSYAVHDNMRSHTGGLVSFGIGAAHTRSTTSKINVKSATESELVAASEYLPYTIWFRHFMEEQGYKIKDNVLYQDNKSAILMEINGRNSCTGNSRHIHIRYFWIKDKVDNNEVRVQYLPTHIMLADYFTKPLQGSQFRLLRDFIMGWRSLEELVIERDENMK